MFALGHMREKRKKLQPAIVSFSSTVSVSFGHKEETHKAPSASFSGNVLKDADKLFEEGKALVKDRRVPSAKDNCTKLEQVVIGVEPDGMTAMGPALAVALGIASAQPGSKVIICTDGAANRYDMYFTQYYTVFLIFLVYMYITI